MKPSEQTRFDSLLEWSENHGGKLHPSLEIYNDNVTKYSLRVKPSIADALQPGFSAVTCPAATTLSYLNALVDGPINHQPADSPSNSPTAAFPPGFTQSLPPHVLGRFFLIKEYLKGKDSLWWPYLATLPSPDQISAWVLPPFWPYDEIRYLEGTNAHVAIQEIQANVKGEFKQARKLLKAENFPDVAAYTNLMYKWAFCIFTSRSFRPSLILSDATKQHVSTLLPEGVELDDFSILQPVLDIANHSPTARYSWDTTSPADACTLICRDRYAPGAQIFNNYGLKTNSELLLGYGFILPPTPDLHNDYVHVRKTTSHRTSPSPDPNQDQDQDPGSNVVSPSRSPTTNNNATNPLLPQTFLVSLRPIAHPSSVVSWARPRRPPSDQSPSSTETDGHDTSTSTSTSTGTSTSTSRGLALLPCFAHFEPALLCDLATTLAAPEQVRLADRWLREVEMGQVRVGGVAMTEAEAEEAARPPGEVARVVQTVREALEEKMRFDYGVVMELGLGREEDVRWQEADLARMPGMAEFHDSLLPPRTGNQRLAVQYRRQYAKVLEAAMESLAGEDWGTSAVWSAMSE